MQNKNGALSRYNYFETKISFLSEDIQFLPKQVQQFLIETAAHYGAGQKA
jgi:hypothetical protein